MLVVGRYAAVGVVAVSLGACGSSTSGTPPTAAAACSDYATKVCERAQACEPGLLPLFGYVTTADCLSGQAASCQRGLAEPHTGYTPARAQACSDALGAMNCAAFRSQTTASACFPRGGTIAVGGSCSDGWQCASGHCSVTVFGQCGACVAPVPLGQSCTNTGECADNLVCSASAPDNASLVCTTPVGIGGACNDGNVCPLDTHCDRTTHTCAKLPALGESCDPSVVFFCDPAAMSGVCDSATSLCEAVVVVQPGAACSSSPTTCAGGVCSYDVDGGAGICVGNLPDGSSCLPTDPCAFGSSCVGGTCQPVVCDGTPTDAGATAFVAAGPWSPGRQASVVDRSRQFHPWRR